VISIRNQAANWRGSPLGLNGERATGFSLGAAACLSLAIAQPADADASRRFPGTVRELSTDPSGHRWERS
jgi:hypothetical protein